MTGSDSSSEDAATKDMQMLHMFDCLYQTKTLINWPISYMSVASANIGILGGPTW